MALFHLGCFLLCTTVQLKITVFIANLFKLYAHNIILFLLCFFLLGFSTMSSFNFYTTVRLKYVILYHLFFLLCTNIEPKLGSSLFYFFYLYTTIRQKYMSLFYLFFILYTTIRPIRVIIDLFILFAHDQSTKLYGPLSFILSFVHDHSTKS